MQYNVAQVDRRISAHNYRALWKAQDTLQRLGVIKSVFDVNKHIEPKFILNVMQTYPALFSTCSPSLRTWRSSRASCSSPDPGCLVGPCGCAAGPAVSPSTPVTPIRRTPGVDDAVLRARRSCPEASLTRRAVATAGAGKACAG